MDWKPFFGGAAVLGIGVIVGAFAFGNRSAAPVTSTYPQQAAPVAVDAADAAAAAAEAASDANGDASAPAEAMADAAYPSLPNYEAPPVTRAQTRSLSTYFANCSDTQFRRATGLFDSIYGKIPAISIIALRTNEQFLINNCSYNEKLDRYRVIAQASFTGTLNGEEYWTKVQTEITGSGTLTSTNILGVNGALAKSAAVKGVVVVGAAAASRSGEGR